MIYIGNVLNVGNEFEQHLYSTTFFKKSEYIVPKIIRCRKFQICWLEGQQTPLCRILIAALVSASINKPQLQL